MIFPDPPEQNIIPKRRPAPPYYLVGHHVSEIGHLTGDLPFNMASAINYCWRAGRKPGADVIDDLLKAVDHLLMEVERQERLAMTLRRKQDAV